MLHDHLQYFHMIHVHRFHRLNYKLHDRLHKILVLRTINDLHHMIHDHRFHHQIHTIHVLLHKILDRLLYCRRLQVGYVRLLRIRLRVRLRIRHHSRHHHHHHRNAHQTHEVLVFLVSFHHL
ncbi:hypothetical protein O3M35_002322 [Rhynocoris fuscipes]|uniref:Uncharacterized protein n=1 Tax=Rhynocoris fuscipes TaxID=488301 RepID=A0AAW1CNF5_9HEMI